MANSAEDLEFNPFFKALQVSSLMATCPVVYALLLMQSQYYSLYEKAQQHCWLVCIPASASLQTCSINKHFAGQYSPQP